jgi:SAM-dependent methyltransferase
MFVGADAYDAFVGRYGTSLAKSHVAAARVEPQDRVLDVGCGTGALTQVLAEIVGPAGVVAVDPSPDFVAACRRKVPGVDVRIGTAEELPGLEATFDVVLSQLVLNFMSDAEAGVRAMRDAARSGGVVASCVWDYAEGMTMLRTYWDAVLDLDPNGPDEARTMPYSSPEELAALWTSSGLTDVETGELEAVASYESFDDLWAPIPTGVGPAGAYCASLDPEHQRALRERFEERLEIPAGRFTLSARAWFVRGRVA